MFTCTIVSYFEYIRVLILSYAFVRHLDCASLPWIRKSPIVKDIALYKSLLENINSLTIRAKVVFKFSYLILLAGGVLILW